MVIGAVGAIVAADGVVRSATVISLVSRILCRVLPLVRSAASPDHVGSGELSAVRSRSTEPCKSSNLGPDLPIQAVLWKYADPGGNWQR